MSNYKKAQTLGLSTAEHANKGSNFVYSGMTEHSKGIYSGSVWPSIGLDVPTITLLPAHRVMCDDIYIPLWQEYKAMGLSANGVLSFQETMIYQFPGKLLSSCGAIEIPKPCIINLWGWRRNVTNYLQENNGLPRRRIRYPERVKFLKVALDIRDLLLSSQPTSRDTIH